jgi:uncharacterized cupin superfamily protein
MMKNQLAGLMKQAQAMQDNMKKAQDEIAAMEVEGAWAPATACRGNLGASLAATAASGRGRFRTSAFNCLPIRIASTWVTADQCRCSSTTF